MIKIYSLAIGLSLYLSTNANILENTFTSSPHLILKSKDSISPVSVVWNSESLVYYTTGINDSTTNLDIFDADGIFAKSYEFTFPINGIWYNNTLDFVEAYNSESNSCFSFFTDDEGMFENQDTLHRLSDVQESTNRTMIVYNAEKDIYAYVEPVTGMIIEIEPHSGEIIDYISVQFPVDKRKIDYQYFFYTDLAHSPYALINTKDQQLYFVNYDGIVVETFSLPQLEISPLAYSFTNGLLWLYHAEMQSWLGYAMK